MRKTSTLNRPMGSTTSQPISIPGARDAMIDDPNGTAPALKSIMRRHSMYPTRQSHSDLLQHQAAVSSACATQLAHSPTQPIRTVPNGWPPCTIHVTSKFNDDAIDADDADAITIEQYVAAKTITTRYETQCANRLMMN